MKYIVTADEMREYDNNTIERIGIPSMVLMERAALALRDVILKRKKLKAGKKVLIVTGNGNNGADGLALARLLAEEHYDVTVWSMGNPERATEQCLQQGRILSHYPVKVYAREEALGQLEQATDENYDCFDIVVDAVFGVGLSRKVAGDYARVLEAMNKLQAYKVAVDIPSGIGADNGAVLGVAFKADITVTFGFGKRGLYLYPGAYYAGQVHIAEIGISERAFFNRMPQVFTYDESPETILPKRREDGNKGTFGKVLVIAGFEHMAGAAVLCSRAALEMGAGMVKVLCPLENRAVLQTAVPEVLYGTCEDLESGIKWADVVAIGPGLGQSGEAFDILMKVLKGADLPIVIDADALNLISASKELKTILKTYPGDKIMTPHVGELARLTGEQVSVLKERLLDVAKKLAKEYDSVMVCKDAGTFVADNKAAAYLNLTGNNGMATAGSGDVLTGMIAGLLAQKKDAFWAASTGVYFHGLAGDFARDAYTEYGVTASRIVENIHALFEAER